MEMRTGGCSMTDHELKLLARIRFIHMAYAGAVEVDWSKGLVSQPGKMMSRLQWR